ncbi:MAG: hypothetical protein ACXAD7_27545 [Candidatus Kariarchaeaceae archaeon]
MLWQGEGGHLSNALNHKNRADNDPLPIRSLALTTSLTPRSAITSYNHETNGGKQVLTL